MYTKRAALKKLEQRRRCLLLAVCIVMFGITYLLSGATRYIDNESYSTDRLMARKIDSVGLHVVYCLVLPDDSTFSHLNYTLLDKLIQHNLRVVNEFHGDLHLITNDDVIIDLASHLHGLHIVDYRTVTPSAHLKAFRDSYLPQSANPIEYEALCLWRWIMIADYFQDMRLRGSFVHRILAIDTDVVLLGDPQAFGILQNWTHEQESYRIVSGAAMMWTLEGIQNFASFLVKVYSSSDTLIQFIKTHGQKFPFCREDRSLVIPCSNSENEMWHLSDMHAQNGWSSQNTTLRRVWHENEDKACHVIAQAGQQAGFHFAWNGSTIIGYAPSATIAKPVCLVHFQGNSKASVLPFLSFVQEKASDYWLPQ